jgi:hypothetical protein
MTYPVEAGTWMTVLYLYGFPTSLNASIMEREDAERNLQELIQVIARETGDLELLFQILLH